MVPTKAHKIDSNAYIFWSQVVYLIQFVNPNGSNGSVWLFLCLQEYTVAACGAFISFNDPWPMHYSNIHNNGKETLLTKLRYCSISLFQYKWKGSEGIWASVRTFRFCVELDLFEVEFNIKLSSYSKKVELGLEVNTS
jgi:hypothetical protein